MGGVVRAESDKRCRAADEGFDLDIFVNVAEVGGVGEQGSDAAFNLVLVDVPIAPSVAVGELMGRGPAGKDVEAGVIVQVDKAGEDEVIGFENLSIGQVGLFFIYVKDVVIGDFEPRVGKDAVGSDDVAADDQVWGVRRLSECGEGRKGCKDGGCQDAGHGSVMMPHSVGRIDLLLSHHPQRARMMVYPHPRGLHGEADPRPCG